MKYDTARPYVAVYMLFRKDGKLLFVKRANTDWMNGRYGSPAGKVEKDEPSLHAAVREAKEEVGVDVKPEDLKHVLTCNRGGDDMDWIDLVFEASAWEGEPFNAEPHMHSEIAWLDEENLPDTVIPNNKFMIDQIKLGNTYVEYNWTSHDA